MEFIALFGALGFFGAVFGVYGIGIVLAIKRNERDKRQSGVLSNSDGETYLLEDGRNAKRAGYQVSRAMVALETGPITRVTISGIELARILSFRLVGLTHATAQGLEGRLVVDGTRNPTRARRLFDRDEVKEALRVLCGATATFRQVNLYPGGDLIVDVSEGPIDDLLERLLRFCEALDAAAPQLDDDRPQLGSTSGSASSAAFSIEIRS